MIIPEQWLKLVNSNLSNLDPLYPMMRCVRFGWYWRKKYCIRGCHCIFPFSVLSPLGNRLFSYFNIPFSLPKDVLCQVWLNFWKSSMYFHNWKERGSSKWAPFTQGGTMAQWFGSRSFEMLSMYINISTMSLFWPNWIKFLCFMLCVKFDWNWSLDRKLHIGYKGVWF